MEFRGNLPSSLPSRTDWERVRRNIARSAPIPYDANDPDDGPYDPNDDEAVDRFLTEENRLYSSIEAGVAPISKAS